MLNRLFDYFIRLNILNEAANRGSGGRQQFIFLGYTLPNMIDHYNCQSKKSICY